jgi:hypothetical protein
MEEGEQGIEQSQGAPVKYFEPIWPLCRVCGWGRLYRSVIDNGTHCSNAECERKRGQARRGRKKEGLR